MHKTSRLGSVALSIGLAACGTSSSNTPPNASDSGTDTTVVSDSGVEDGGPSDTVTIDGETGDGGKDWLGIIEAARNAIQHGETSIDLNGDGTKDYTRTLGDGGTLVGEKIDVDGDGKTTMVWDYASTPHTYTETRNGTVVDHIEVTQDPTNPDAATFVEVWTPIDTTLPAERWTYTLDPTVDPIAVTVDLDHGRTGTYDTTYSITTPLHQPFLASIATGTCTDAQANQLDAAFDQGVVEGMVCLAAFDPLLALKFEWLVVTTNITLECQIAPSGCAQAEVDKVVHHWFGTADGTILVFPFAFDPKQCGPLEGVLLHELLHFFFGLHQADNPADDPSDPVYGCQKTCFGNQMVAAGAPASYAPSSQTCAACLRVKNGDKRCFGDPSDPCADVPALCTCGPTAGTVYKGTECPVKCGGGLGCFGSARCQPVGPCR